MDSVKVTYELPAELVERAKELGIDVENQTNWVIDLVEKQIRKAEAMREFTRIAEALSSLPDEMKPTPEEIQEEIRAYWAEKAANEQK